MSKYAGTQTEKNLQAAGFDKVWLQKKLKHAGFYSENELLVAQMNKDTVYMQEKGGKKCCTIRVK